ncbi:MAG: DUF4349 domain-containing protein [Polyangiaceae bacterium]
MMGQAAKAAPQDAAPGPGVTSIPDASRALRITTETTLASDDVGATVQAIREAVDATGGYISDARVGDMRQSKNADIEARIPVTELASFRSSVGALGEIVSDNEKAEDVTEQRADLGARLRNARTEEKRLLDILSNRTGALADVLAAERSLADCRDRIERLEAEDTVLENQIALATVKLHIRERTAPKVATTVGDDLAVAGRRGVDMAGSMMLGIAIAAATLGPSLAILALPLLLIVFAIRFTRARRRAARPQSAAVSP